GHHCTKGAKPLARIRIPPPIRSLSDFTSFAQFLPCRRPTSRATTGRRNKPIIDGVPICTSKASLRFLVYSRARSERILKGLSFGRQDVEQNVTP
ncbi:hypothetical protein J3323_11045, partial [Leuconostoc mesenteroides]|nr:hypothetical protein [Leuconostoc mesenteroides]